MAKQSFTLQPPKGDKHKEPYTTASAAEAVNLRARGWTDVAEGEGESSDDATDPGTVDTKQRTPKDKARSAS